MNTFFVASVVTVIQLVTASMAGFAFATLRFRGSRIVFFTMLAQTMLPVAVLLIPLFKVTMSLGLVGNVWGMIIPFTFTAFGTFLMTQYFKGVPRELFEAARVDGATHLQLFRRIAVPLALPGIVSFAIIDLIFVWNDLLLALTLLERDHQPITVGLANLQSPHLAQEDVVSAGAILAILPPLLLFALLNRYYVRGLFAGGVKG